MLKETSRPPDMASRIPSACSGRKQPGFGFGFNMHRGRLTKSELLLNEMTIVAFRGRSPIITFTISSTENKNYCNYLAGCLENGQPDNLVGNIAD